MTQAQALTILKTGANVFLTGEPGAGKSHTVNAYVAYLREHSIEPAITASTGIAATHIGGMTIHSWSGIGIKTTLTKYDLDKIASSEYVAKRVSRTQVLIIDEVSMLAPSMLSMIDQVLKEIRQNDAPFGGMQVILVGDFFQLPPIQKINYGSEDQTMFDDEQVAIFAYESPEWAALRPIVCYLTEQYRQDDKHFLSVLQALRAGEIGEVHMEHILSRQIAPTQAPPDITRLFSHNADVDSLNTNALSKLTSRQKTYEMSSRGPDALVATLARGCLSPETLTLKIGASVMFTKNNPLMHFANGTLGTVEDFDTDTGAPIIRTKSGHKVIAESMEWSVQENGVVRASISQIPLRLAWAITVHKSQGMSLDAAVMDLSQVFEYGQGYVALSRVRRLSGLYLLGINQKALAVHPAILEEDASFRARSEEARLAFSKLPATDLQKMYDNFVRACGGTLQAVKSKKSERARTGKKLSTYDVTLGLWKEGMTVALIARERGVQSRTIFDHIEKLFKQGAIDRTELLRLLTPKISKGLAEIHRAFKAAGTDKLTPVYEKLGSAFTFDEIRIARMLME